MQFLGVITMKSKNAVLCLASFALLSSCAGTTSKPNEEKSTEKETVSSGQASVSPSESDAGAKKEKTRLTVATYDGGLGVKWLESLATRFEEKYKGTSFESGKEGVTVSVVSSRSYNGTTLLSGALEQDVYFTEDVSYFDHINKGNFLDISDIVTPKMTDFGEKRSIEDKLSDEMKGFLTAKDSKYYALPFYDGLYGLIYDHDLFEEKNLFFGEDGKFVSSKTAVKSAGPNGKKGDYDDGLPATYDQFYKLVEAIEGKSMNPFSFSGSTGSANQYIYRTMSSYWSDYEGYENMKVNYTLDGTVPLVSSINNGSASVYNVKIDSSNGYLLQKQEGKLKALQFLKTITGHMKRNSNTSTQAQTNFIRNYSLGKDQYAMLFDGAWWENEATTAFNNSEAKYGKGKADKRYGFMPIPKASEGKIGEKQTLVSQNLSYCFVSAKTKHPELSKLFLQYAHTDENLSAFTAELSLTRALSYDLTESDKSKATFYAKNLIELKNDSNILNPVSSNEKVIRNPSTFSLESWAWTTTILGNKQYSNPYAVFSDSATSSTTAEEYFEGLSTYMSEEKWKGLN